MTPNQINLPDETDKVGYGGSLLSKSEQKKRIRTPLVYLFIFRNMIRHYGQNNVVVPTRKIIEFWHRITYNLPKCYDLHLLNEMEGYGLIEKVDKHKYKFFGKSSYYQLSKLSQYFLW